MEGLSGRPSARVPVPSGEQGISPRRSGPRCWRGARASVAVAESCTGGLISKRVTDRAGFFSVLPGGMVAYSDEAKIRESEGPLGPILREAWRGEQARGRVDGPGGCGADSEPRRGSGSRGSLAPEAGSDERPVGTVWYSGSLEGVVSARLELFLGDRAVVRERAAQAAMDLLLGSWKGGARDPDVEGGKDPGTRGDGARLAAVGGCRSPGTPFFSCTVSGSTPDGIRHLAEVPRPGASRYSHSISGGMVARRVPGPRQRLSTVSGGPSGLGRGDE